MKYMNRKFNTMRKGMAMLLAAALVLELSPSLSGIVEARAEGTGTEGTPAAGSTIAKPSVTAYATSEDLETEFKPDEGTKAIGKLKFGKNEAGDIQKWYILGEDDGVSVDNTAIFADSNITIENIEYNYAFCGQNPPYVGSRDVSTLATYADADKPTAGVFWNHYAVSDVKDNLSKMAKNTGYFSETEQALMNETTVTTEDYKTQDGKWRRYYTTSDKLYAPGGDPNRDDSSNIYVGSKNSKLDMGTYWGSGDSFWLRSPDYSSSYSSSSNLYAPPQQWVKCDRTNGHHGVRPASNLNLTDVLFASAALASTGDAQPALGADVSAHGITDDAMSLRLDGGDEIDKSIGSVFYSSKDNTVTAIKGDTDKKVSLIIQGKSDDNDWYISETISGYYKLELNKEGGQDVSQCKIWLEIPLDDSSTLAYAVEATEHDHTFGEDYKANGTNHWQECTDQNCPAPDKGKSATIEEHNYGDEKTWYHDNDEHYRKCTVCESDESIKEDTRAAHKLNKDGICDTCGYNMNKEHKFEYVPAKDASCTATGNKEYWKCTDAGCDVKYYTVLGLPIQFTALAEGNVLIPANGHTLSANYGSDSTSHWKECTVCRSIEERKAHTFSGAKCTVCGYDNSSRNSGSGSSGGSGGSGGGSGANSSSGISSIIGAGNVYGTWIKDNIGWRYKYSDGTYASGSSANDAEGKVIEKVAWVNVNNAAYAFGSDTYLKSGWVLDNSDAKWYYCDEDKGRLYGWFYDTEGGYWYYLDANTGAMLTGWQLIGGKQYYFAPAPAAATYTFDAASSKWVYSNAANNYPYGSMYAGTTTPDNYQVDANGARVN